MPDPLNKKNEDTEKELDEAFQTAHDVYGIVLGQFVPGLSSKPPEPTISESSGSKGPRKSPSPRSAAEAGSHDFSDFEQCKDYDKSNLREKPSFSARSHSKESNKTKVKSEQSDDDPTPPNTDEVLPIIVESPTSLEEQSKQPEEMEIRTPRFEPDFSDGNAEIDPPEEVHEREDPGSLSKVECT